MLRAVELRQSKGVWLSMEPVSIPVLLYFEQGATSFCLQAAFLLKCECLCIKTIHNTKLNYQNTKK